MDTNYDFSHEILSKIRKALPNGAQAEIARRLSTPENKVSREQVRKVLHGLPIRYKKINSSAIIKEAITIYNEVTRSKAEAMEALSAAVDTTK